MPDVIDKMGEIFKRIIDHNLHIGNIKMVKLSQDDAKEFYDNKEGGELS